MIVSCTILLSSNPLAVSSDYTDPLQQWKNWRFVRSSCPLINLDFPLFYVRRDFFLATKHPKPKDDFFLNVLNKKKLKNQQNFIFRRMSQIFFCLHSIVVIRIPVKLTKVFFSRRGLTRPTLNQIKTHKNTMKPDIVPLCSISLCSSHTPSSPDDPAAHLSRLLWLHKHIQRHIRGALVLWLAGWGFMGLTFKPPPLPCLPNHKQTTTSQRSYCGALRWHHLRPHRQPLPHTPPTPTASSISVS